jgi:hypothetical protein
MNEPSGKNTLTPCRIKVFPNSGHQYFDIPLKELLPQKDTEFLEKLARTNNNLSWQKWSDYAPWILYRYEIQDDIPILRVCVETNLGTPDRGLLFEVEDELRPEAPEEEDIVNPYASNDEAQIESDYRDRLLPLTSLPNKEGRDLEVQLEIHWVKRGGYDPVDVDLIVDLGNTRTVALLLETPGPEAASRQLRRRVQILRFIPRGMPLSFSGQGAGSSILMDDCAIIDSWMLLHRTQFHDLEPPESREKLSTFHDPVTNEKGEVIGYRTKHYLPHTFVELSPALIGGGRTSPNGARRIYAMCKLDTDARFYLGSPKRYVWDNEPQGVRGGTFWRQIPNDTDKNIPPDYFGWLGGLFRYFMDPGGKDWDIDNQPSEDDFAGLPFPKSEPSYPRRDTVCWFALSILEAAQRQINSQHYLSIAGRESLPRRLHNVRITYPAGWTHEERSCFFAQWQRAINLFTMTRFENHAPVSFGTDRSGGCRPILSDSPLDEAVCSQLPIIYSDVKSLMGDGQSWLDLYGDGESVTVMNVDIGGGTTDMAIIRYSLASAGKTHGGNATMQTKLLFRDGCSIAGDMLVKRIIETVLLPAWMEACDKSQYEGLPDARAWVTRFFKKPTHAEFAPVDSKASIKLARIVRLVFVPLVNQWLSQLVNSAENPEGGWEKLDIGEALATNLIDNQSLDELNEILNKVIRQKARNGTVWQGTVFSKDRNTFIHCDKATIEKCVDDVFGNLFDHLARLAGRFDCQLAIVSGKPSELPRIKERLAKSFPLLPQRIIHMKNFPAGDWYPFSTFNDGRIVDAKTCTVVGAALYQDICNGNLPGMTMQEESDKRPSRQYYWSILPANGVHDAEKAGHIFTPADYPRAEGETIQSAPKRIEMTLPCRIGRQIIPVPGVRPDAVYEIRYNPALPPPRTVLRAYVTLRWVSTRGEGERLELVKVENHPDCPGIDPSDISMRLNTMLEESHWLDEPRFDLETV